MITLLLIACFTCLGFHFFHIDIICYLVLWSNPSISTGLSSIEQLWLIYDNTTLSLPLLAFGYWLGSTTFTLIKAVNHPKIHGLPDTKFETHPRSMFSGAGDAFSRRHWASSLLLLTAHILCFMVHCSVCLLLVRFWWNLEGRRFRLTLRQRRLFVVLLPAILLLRLVPPPAMSREGFLTAALLWSSGSDPVVPSFGCRQETVSFLSKSFNRLWSCVLNRRAQPLHLRGGLSPTSHRVVLLLI